jgi:hypothetical protein
MESSRRIFITALPVLASGMRTRAEDHRSKNADLHLIVLDPLAGPLACACVDGYAQRKYERLADFLMARFKKSIRIIWNDSLRAAFESEPLVPSIVIGKDSVIRATARDAKRLLSPIAQLTDSTGSTQQTGLFVVKTKNKAASILDLDGYTIHFGPSKCDEKSLAPLAKLSEVEIDFIAGEHCDTCGLAAKKLQDAKDEDKIAAVISSYAIALLEGCGNVKKGEIRVVGSTDEVPFISAFVDSSIPKDIKAQIQSSLLEFGKSDDNRRALESKLGFIAYAG